MKTACALVALACALACTAAAAEADASRAGGSTILRRPRMPTVAERQKAMVEAVASGRGVPRPAGSLPRDAFPDGARSFVRKGPLQQAAKPHTKERRLKQERQPQPDIAGRVAVTVPKQPKAVRKDGGLKIINGDTAVLGQFPWQAGVKSVLDEYDKVWCGGSIISSLWILSAGHCVDDGAEYLLISVGSLGSEEGTEPSRQEFKTTEFYQHPEYNADLIDNDISVIKLDTHITFSAWCRPVRLPTYSMATDMMVGTTGLVSGWGRTADSDSWITSQLLYTQTTIDDGSACYSLYGNVWIPNKICIKVHDEESFCQGDSGGAFTIVEDDGVHTQIGIVSFGGKSCENDSPIAYTRLASFLQFVEDTTNIAVRP